MREGAILKVSGVPGVVIMISLMLALWAKEARGAPYLGSVGARGVDHDTFKVLRWGLGMREGTALRVSLMPGV